MRVGVILAARAPVPYLREALASVHSQEPAPEAVVVVDHASQPPVAGATVRLEDPGGGPARARAAGLGALGSVDLVALADADDVWEPGKLAAQLEAMAAHPQAAVCFGGAVVIDAAGRETGERLPELAPGLHPAERLMARLYAANPIPAASAVVRLDALVAAGGFESGAELPAGSDWDLWLRLAAAGHGFVCEPRARIRYRRHSGGLTADLERLARAGLQIHERHRGLVDEAAATEARARDLETLARAAIRARRYAEARSRLDEANDLRRLGHRDRALRAALEIPGLRSALGRRPPYR